VHPHAHDSTPRTVRLKPNEVRGRRFQSLHGQLDGYSEKRKRSRHVK
jgi:hypothetical protein